MRYIYNQKIETIEFDYEELVSVLVKKDPELINEEFLKDFNDNIDYIYSANEDNQFYNENKSLINADALASKLQTKTEHLRNNILSKFMLGTNLHFLMSNGCSMYAGSKAINKLGVSEHSKLVKEFKLRKYENIQATINQLENVRPEKALDTLFEVYSYCQNVLQDEETSALIDTLINSYKKAFVNNFVLTIDYNKNHLHKLFLKRVVSRDPKLNKVNIFTPNYDLLIEKTAEELMINVNNGFHGFHYRSFLPSSFNLDMHINLKDKNQAYARMINLFKLHGSLSWKFDSNKPPYGITEVQHNYQDVTSIEDLPDCIIYPVQSKKKHSLDLPYSEMFRQFIEFINKPDSTLVIMGYSFLDEHINDIITNALSNPDFNLVVFSYQDISDNNLSPYLKDLISRSQDDSRISVFLGAVLGNFDYIVKYLIPYPYDSDSDKVVYETFQKLKYGVNSP